MSGFFYGDEDPSQQARTQMMADILQGRQAQGQQNPLGGLQSAIMQKSLENNRLKQQGQDFANARLAASGQSPVKFGWDPMANLSGLFSFGGGK